LRAVWENRELFNTPILQLVTTLCPMKSSTFSSVLEEAVAFDDGDTGVGVGDVPGVKARQAKRAATARRATTTEIQTMSLMMPFEVAGSGFGVCGEGYCP